MSNRQGYNPLERDTFDAIALNAVGRASEIEGFPAYRLSHSTGNSGWSVGAVQWDFGQPGRGGKVGDLLQGYQAWAAPTERFSAAEIESLSRRLQIRGQSGNELSAREQERLGDYLVSDRGRAFVDGLNSEQLDRKWKNVGQPLSNVAWLRGLAKEEPAEAAAIVAMTTKLFNQNERKGKALIRQLDAGEMDAAEVKQWIGISGVEGLSAPAKAAILSGRDKTLAGIGLVNALEASDGRLGRAWREQIHERGNPGLTADFNRNPDVQLLDAMLRNVSAGQRILAHVDAGAPAANVTIAGVNEAARREMARVTLSKEGLLSVESPDGDTHRMTGAGWSLQKARGKSALAEDVETVVSHRVAGEPDGGQVRESVERLQRDPMYREVEMGVRRLDTGLGREFDECSARMTANLTQLARENGFQRVDHVVLSIRTPSLAAGENAFVVQGRIDDPANRTAHMRTADAANTPVEVAAQRHENVLATQHAVELEREAQNVVHRGARV